MGKKRNQNPVQLPDMAIRCRRDILLIPPALWLMTIGFPILLWNLDGTPASRRMAVGLLAFLAICSGIVTYGYGLELAVTLETRGDVLWVQPFGGNPRAYAMEELTEIRRSRGKGVTFYDIYVGKKPIAHFSDFFPDADLFLQSLRQRNPGIRV